MIHEEDNTSSSFEVKRGPTPLVFDDRVWKMSTI
jgi:hypothetical protein